jgi:hypothetical protein
MFFGPNITAAMAVKAPSSGGVFVCALRGVSTPSFAPCVLFLRLERSELVTVSF